MKKNWTVWIGIPAMVMLFTGCASQQSRVEKDYGNSYRLAISNQTLNPEAQKNLEPVYGFNGQAAKAAIERYQKGFEKAQPAPTYTTIGTTGSVGMGQ